MSKTITYIFLSILVSFSLSASELEHVSLQLQWKHQFEFAGFYIAKEKGYYKDVGLDVEIKEFDNSVDFIRSVLEKQNSFAIAAPSIVLDEAASNNIVLISAILQSSPHVLVSLKSSGIKSIKDFKNKRIMIDEHEAKSASFVSMLHSQDMSFSQTILQKPTFDVKSLINNDTDIASYYYSNELYELDKKGIAYDVWNPKDYGFDFYNDLLFTSQKTLKNSPELVESFRTASLKGWDYAFTHIDETVELILKKYNSQNKTEGALLYEAHILKELAYRGVEELGELDKNKVQRIGDIYNILGLVRNKIDLESFIYKPQQQKQFNQEEQEYLRNKKSINMCIDPSWMPFESFENGKHIGMSADFFQEIGKVLPLKIHVIKTEKWEESMQLAKERKCDILSLVMSTPEREKYLKFTDPYLKIPLVMATKIDAPFVADFSSIKKKKVGITKGYAFVELLKAKYPDMDIVEVKNIRDGLDRVSKNELYGYIGTLASIGYTLQKEFTGELKIAGKFDGTWDLGVGVRDDDPLLFSVMQKAVQSIDERTKQQILNNWLSIQYDSKIDYYLLLKIFGGFALIILIIFYFYLHERKLKKEVQLNHILLEGIINNIPNPMFYKDKNGTYQNINDAFAEEILGFSKKLILGKKLYELSKFMPKSLVDIYEQRDKKLFEESELQEYEIAIQVSNGTTRDYKINRSVLYSDTNESLGYIGILSDITELKEKERKLKELASVDPLSKLYNRRYFSTTAKHIFHLARREKFHLSIVMMDIDDFKSINDKYGHKVGDDVIVLISKELQNISRTSDIVCRFGGEEFILLLPKTDINGALIIAEKIRKRVAAIDVDVHERETLSFTISSGVSEVQLDEEENIEAAIKRADDALYEAKASGKNKVSKA